MQTLDTNYIYKNELDKASFVHDATYSDSKDLTKRTAADKFLRDKPFIIAKDPKYAKYTKEDQLPWFINLLIKKLQVGVLNLYLGEGVLNLYLKMSN